MDSHRKHRQQQQSALQQLLAAKQAREERQAARQSQTGPAALEQELAGSDTALGFDSVCDLSSPGFTWPCTAAREGKIIMTESLERQAVGACVMLVVLDIKHLLACCTGSRKA